METEPQHLFRAIVTRTNRRNGVFEHRIVGHGDPYTRVDMCGALAKEIVDFTDDRDTPEQMLLETYKHTNISLLSTLPTAATLAPAWNRVSPIRKPCRYVRFPLPTMNRPRRFVTRIESP